LEVGSAGEPVVHDTDGNARLCCQVPEDIVALRRKDGPLARQWRFALRATLGTAVREEGFTATGMSRSGWYVLERPGARRAT
jgi:predicted GNAT superfamily acetyltransferase